MKRNIAILLLIFVSLSCFAANPHPDVVEKHVRTFIKKGNEAYRAKDYTKAETYYREAISEDKNSSPSYFNLALTLLRKNGNPLKGNTADNAEGSVQNDDSSNPIALFSNVIALNNNDKLVTSSYYNMGNIYFEAEKYAESIDQYKNVLRRNPDNIKARQNLRIAQLKLEEQKQNQQQKNQENKEQNQQDKNKDQQQKQNQDKNEQNKDKNQEKQDQDQSQQKSDEKQSPQKQNQGGYSSGKPAMSKENSEKILESARKQEEQTRKKVERRKGERMTRRTTDRPW